MTSFDISRRRLVAGGLAAITSSVLGARKAGACATADQFHALWPELIHELPLDQPRSVTHPLAGRVWSATRPWAENAQDSCGFDANFKDMRAAVATTDITCLGEVHDNPAHHIFRAKLVSELSFGSKPPGAVFEQISDDQQAGLDRFREFDRTAARLGTASDLIRFIDWDKSAWSKMADYTPLFEAVIRARIDLHPGDVSRDVIKRAAKEGLSAVLSVEELNRLALDKPLGEAADAASLAEIEESHCGLLPKDVVPRLAAAQRLRDAHLADAVLRAVGDKGAAFLFAGNGHVRPDRGVPWYVQQRAPGKRVVSVQLIEVEDGKTDPEGYIPRSPDGKPAADFAVFTPKVSRADPCEAMKARKPK